MLASARIITKMLCFVATLSHSCRLDGQTSCFYKSLLLLQFEVFLSVQDPCAGFPPHPGYQVQVFPNLFQSRYTIVLLSSRTEFVPSISPETSSHVFGAPPYPWLHAAGGGHRQGQGGCHRRRQGLQRQGRSQHLIR